MNIFLEVFQHSRWFIEPDALQLLMQSLKEDNATKSLEENMKSFFKDPEDDVVLKCDIRNGVATVPLYGPIFPKSNIMTWLGYATALTDLQAAFERLKADDSVTEIVLNCHSPGGVVFGVNAFAQYLKAYNKPVKTYVPGLCCSAAYWIASASDEIVVDSTAMVGSIGVVCDVMNPEHDPYIEITNRKSPNKRPNPATEEGKGTIQDELDALADVFIATVAENRGVSVSVVESDFGKGGVLIGEKAVNAKMVDKVATFEAFLAECGTVGVSGNSDNYNDGENIMNLEELKAKHPKLWKEIEGSFATSEGDEKPTDSVNVTSELASTIEATSAKVDKLTEAVTGMNEKFKVLEKTEAVRTEQDYQNTADTIADSVLAGTRLSGVIKGKIKKAVSYADYVSEDGKFDTAKFKEAVEKEATDYKEALSGTLDVDGASAGEDFHEPNTLTDDAVDNLLAEIGVDVEGKEA